MRSISEARGLKVLSSSDRQIYSVGISTAGAAEIQMANQDPSRHIIATTLDPEGASFAKKAIESAHLSSQICVKIENVASPLPYPNKSFDYIYARLVLHYLPKRALESALSELYRVLRQGKKLFVIVRSTDCLQAKSSESTFDSDTALTHYLFKGAPASRYFHSQESITKHLQEAGFQIESVTTYNERLCSDFNRLEPAESAEPLIEVVAFKDSLPTNPPKARLSW